VVDLRLDIFLINVHPGIWRGREAGFW